MYILRKPGGKVQTPVYFKRRQAGEGGQAQLSRGAIFRQFRVITFACEIAIIRSAGGLVGRCTLCKGQSLPYTSSLFLCLAHSLVSEKRPWGQFSGCAAGTSPFPISFTAILRPLLCFHLFIARSQVSNYKSLSLSLSFFLSFSFFNVLNL